MATIALTGGTGLLGNVLVPMLLKEGHSLRILARRRTDRELPPMTGVTWIEGALDEIEPIDRLVQDTDCIVHAAYLGLDDAVAPNRSPAEHWVQTNFVGTMRLIERTGGTRGRQLIYLSSLAVFGKDPNNDPVGDRFARNEEFPLWPRDFYGGIRSATEKMVITASHELGLNTSAFRLGCVMGLREPWTTSPLYTAVDEAVRFGEIRSQIGTYSISVEDSARILCAAIGDASLRGSVFNTFDQWFDHANVAPWVAEMLGTPVTIACKPAHEPRSPILGDRIHDYYDRFETERHLRELTSALVERCRAR